MTQQKSCQQANTCSIRENALHFINMIGDALADDYINISIFYWIKAHQNWSINQRNDYIEQRRHKNSSGYCVEK